VAAVTLCQPLTQLNVSPEVRMGGIDDHKEQYAAQTWPCMSDNGQQGK
jgi:hypothetical protein